MTSPAPRTVATPDVTDKLLRERPVWGPFIGGASNFPYTAKKRKNTVLESHCAGCLRMQVCSASDQCTIKNSSRGYSISGCLVGR